MLCILSSDWSAKRSCGFGGDAADLGAENDPALSHAMSSATPAERLVPRKKTEQMLLPSGQTGLGISVPRGIPFHDKRREAHY